MDTDVLIVGAGPTGLMLANQLGRRGVRAVIVDRHSGPAQQSRAIVVQARTMEIYSKLGIADRALELGKIGAGFNMWSEGRWKARIPLGDIGKRLSPFPYILILGQDDNELIMGEKLADWGMAVQWNTELIAIEQHADHVTASIRWPDGSVKKLTAAWLGGCDGARSAVRELSAIGFPGAPYEHVFFVADTVATGPMVPDEANVYMWRDGFHLLFPLRGTDHWRVIGILPRSLSGRDDLTFEQVIPSLRQEAGAALSFKSCSWFSTYRIHHRAAERFRDRRCFLMGDAAHVHSPAGAQGMNTGLQDAHNLAWKLALVVMGRADPALLDSYEAERLPVAQRLLRTTDRVFKLLVSENWGAGLFRTQILARILAFAMTKERVQKFAFRTISQIGIAYRTSELSHTLPGMPEDAPHAGDRFPWLHLQFTGHGPAEDLFGKLDDTCFNLLLFGPQTPSGVTSGGILRTHVIPNTSDNAKELARAQIALPSFYLLRPDGHVALAGEHYAATVVARYLNERHIYVPIQNAGGVAQAAIGNFRGCSKMISPDE